MWFFANRLPRRYHRDHKHHGPHDHHHHDHGPNVETRKSGTREIKVVRRVLDANDIMAERMRTVFAEKKVFVLNMMSSPGSGKTTILQRTLAELMPDIRCAVIVGDICTTQDADRLSASGAPGTYSLPGVPWTSFFIFETGVAFHGTFWHNNFGRRMSHGCVNMETTAAKWIYRWTTPTANARDWYRRGLGTLVIIS